MKSVAEIEHPEVRALAERAEAYVASFAWCDSVIRCVLGFAIAGVLGVFRVDLVPASVNVDPTVWDVVGDLPPAYISFEEGDSWHDALRRYVSEMQAWVDAAHTGESVEDLIPVNAAPTAVYADLLDSRLGFLRQRLLDVAPEDIEGDA